MQAAHRRALFWGALLALLIAALAFAFRPRPVMVDLVRAERGPLQVLVEDEGETRVRDVYVLSAPLRGFLRRIQLRAGDPVEARSTVVARIEPISPGFLDPRSQEQAEAGVRAAEAAEALSRAEVDQAQAELDFASREYERALQLVAEGTISTRDRDAAERSLRTARAALATAMAALEMRRFELQRARAALLAPEETRPEVLDCACVSVRAPVSGRVLRVLHESEGVVEAGTALAEVGDPRDLEVVVDLLSADAVRVEPGQPVRIDRWGGAAPLEGRVRLVEPYGFTKVSALGIEEQRVNVVVDLVSPADDWAALAHGYQVDAAVVLWEEHDVLKLPLLALFREAGRWAVFVEEGGRAVLRHVSLGRRSTLEAQVLEGVEPGERIVLHPSDQVRPGVRIEARGG